MKRTHIVILGAILGAIMGMLLATLPNMQINIRPQSSTIATTWANSNTHITYTTPSGNSYSTIYTTTALPCVPEGVEGLVDCSILDGSGAFILFTPIKIVHKYVVLPGNGMATVGNTTYKNLDVVDLEYLVRIDKVLIYERLGECHLAKYGLGELCDQLQRDMYPGNTIHVITGEYYLFPNGTPIPPQPDWDRYDLVLEAGKQYLGVIYARVWGVKPDSNNHSHYMLGAPLLVINGRVYSPSDLDMEKCYYVELGGIPLDELIPKLRSMMINCWNEQHNQTVNTTNTAS